VKILGLLFILFSSSAWACWSLDLKLAIDGDVFKIQHKTDHDKDYTQALGPYILNFKLKKDQNKSINFIYRLDEKKNQKLVLITQGEEEISLGVNKEIYAKGEENQPHSIITLKLNSI